MRQSPECSRSYYSNLAANVNLNEVTSGVGGWTQHNHPGTPHQIAFLSLSVLSIQVFPSPSLRQQFEWVTPATPHAVGTNRGITVFSIAFWVGRVSGMGWWENSKKGMRRCRRLASLSGLADEHCRTHIPIWVPTDQDSGDVAGALGPSAHRWLNATINGVYTVCLQISYIH